MGPGHDDPRGHVNGQPGGSAGAGGGGRGPRPAVRTQADGLPHQAGLSSRGQVPILTGAPVCRIFRWPCLGCSRQYLTRLAQSVGGRAERATVAGDAHESIEANEASVFPVNEQLDPSSQ